MTAAIRYIVHDDRVEPVGDRTARRHRALFISDRGDVSIYIGGGRVVAMMSRAEVAFIAREARRATVRRAWRWLIGRQ